MSAEHEHVEALTALTGHVVELRHIGHDGDRWVCRGCHQQRGALTGFTTQCPVDSAHPLRVIPVPAPDAAGRTWHTAAVLMGGHRHVTIRYGVEGQRANCGKVVVDDEQWPQLRSVLELLGDVAEAEA